MIDDLFVRLQGDSDRETCVWVIAASQELLDAYAETLFRAHKDLQDWLLTRLPLIIYPITDERENGYILRDVCIISPEKLPRSTMGITCFNYELAQLISPNESTITTAMNFKKLEEQDQILKWANENKLQVGGVHVKEPEPLNLMPGGVIMPKDVDIHEFVEAIQREEGKTPDSPAEVNIYTAPEGDDKDFVPGVTSDEYRRHNEESDGKCQNESQ